MAAIMLDTHAVIKRLREAGFSEQQAEAVAGVLQDTQQLLFEHLATKGDIQDLQRALKELEASTKRDIKELEVSTKRDLKELEAGTKRDLKELETNLRRDMKEMEITLRRDIDVKLVELKADLLKWTVGILLAKLPLSPLWSSCCKPPRLPIPRSSSTLASKLCKILRSYAVSARVYIG